jgi:1-acyl-sn-glycerol-3-phosphate acyltransferase
MWHRLEVVGRANLPTEPPFVLVANHASHLDALALASPLPLLLRNRVFALAAGDVFFDKTLRSAFAATFLNALPLWRRKTPVKALAELRHRLLEEPCAYLIFPEGTRARDGRLTPFKPGIGMMVAGTNVPVVPCHLHGTFEAWPSGRTVPAPGKVRFRVGLPLQFADVPNERKGWDQIAATLHNAVAQLNG